MTDLEKMQRKASLYETFRAECQVAINAFNLGAIDRNEMIKRFTFSDDRLSQALVKTGINP